eukprot:3261333-Pyramimonas_sp.AAC.1
MQPRLPSRPVLRTVADRPNTVRYPRDPWTSWTLELKDGRPYGPCGHTCPAYCSRACSPLGPPT